jgi:hypothetical protein
VYNRVFNNYVSTESFNIELHDKTLAFGNLERIGEEAVVAYIPGATEEAQIKHQSG